MSKWSIDFVFPSVSYVLSNPVVAFLFTSQQRHLTNELHELGYYDSSAGSPYSEREVVSAQQSKTPEVFACDQQFTQSPDEEDAAHSSVRFISTGR